MNTDLKVIENLGRWALFDVRTLRQHTPWLDSSKKALDFADKHCSGWREESDLEVIDEQSFKRIAFQKKEIPRMMQQKIDRQKYAKTIHDLVTFHPIKSEIKRGTGEKHVFYVNDPGTVKKD
jgi:hypothetical protein